ncbi:hypothetical protein [Photobacterium leiognathi]|uniref:hypothetical protein n=1 Tax=Photobacterium leiognathi TaxID=553611 RepID=UPI00273A3340|nr:hypothetical protein [Photobacterium leiognathi]
MINKYRQSGMATLLITSVLLIVALLLSLASYKNLFYQIKRTQNEVVARQSHWLAEGGLECGFSEIQHIKAIPVGGFSYCDSLSLDSLNVLSGTPNILRAKKAGKLLEKSFSTPGTGSPGTIKSTSNIYFAGGVSTFPDPGKSLGSNQWECTVLRYSNFLKVYGTLESKGLDSNVLPYEGFPTSPIQSCVGTHLTNPGVIGAHNLPSGLKSDFIQDPYLEPFEDTFDVPREDWIEVMYNEEFVRIGNGLSLTKPQTSSLPSPLFNDNCGEKIKAKIAQENDLIWVYGGCHITDSELTAIDTEIANKNLDGVILVIQDGILSTKGNHSFKGMIYHFITSSSSYSPTLSDWGKTENLSNLTGLVDHTPDVVTDITVTDVSYYQDGTFNPLGGYVMDGPNTYAVFRNSMSFQFNRDVMDKPLNKIRKIKWIKGSWNDL